MCAHVKNKRGYRASLAFFTFLLPSDLPLRLVGRAPVSTITSDFTSPENSPSFVPIPYFSCHSRVSWPHSPFLSFPFFQTQAHYMCTAIHCTTTLAEGEFLSERKHMHVIWFFIVKSLDESVTEELVDDVIYTITRDHMF